MSLFEKIEPEVIEADEPERSKSSRKREPDQTLTISYQSGMMLLVLLSPLLIWPLFQFFFELGIFFLQIASVAALVYCVWIIADCLVTRCIIFFPDKIVKYTFFGQTELPASSLLMFEKDQDIRLFHASEKNIRESLKIRRFLISQSDFADILTYVEQFYQVRPNEVGETAANQLAVMEYEKADSSYRMMAGFFLLFIVIAVFAVGFSETFPGLAPSLPAYPFRLACIALAVASYFLLRKWSAAGHRVSTVGVEPVMTRLDRADAYAFRCAEVAVGVAGLGTVLFLMFGNTLDLYLFLLVGALYYYDCYPRLSVWEELSTGEPERQAVKERGMLLPRRSLQVSLVLMGTLAVMSYGESNRYLYASRKDCQDDWGDSADCREVSSGGGGGGYHGGGRYYGPRYGSGGGRATRSIGVGTISRGGFGSMGSFHASFGG